MNVNPMTPPKPNDVIATGEFLAKPEEEDEVQTLTPSNSVVSKNELTVDTDENDIPIRGMESTSLEEKRQGSVFDLNVEEGTVILHDGEIGERLPRAPVVTSPGSRVEVSPIPLPRPEDEIRMQKLTEYLRDIGIRP